jgi:predicted permease
VSVVDIMPLRDWQLRLRALVARRRVEQDLDDELAFHIERTVKKLVDQGMAPDRARAAALARFGPTALVADECRDQRGTAFVDETIRDVRFALRSFRRAPLAAFTIVATVAVGLGVVAVLFTLLNRFLFRVDAVPDIGQMYGVHYTGPDDAPRSSFTRPAFEALRRETSAFTDAYATVSDIDLRVDGRMMSATLVTGNFFAVLQVDAVMGRTLVPADDQPGGHRVVVLSDRGWTSRFDRDPHVLGRVVLVRGEPFEIVGVMPAAFRGLDVSAPDLWAPLARRAQFQPEDRGREDSASVGVIGRLRPDVSMDAARAQIAAWDANRRAESAERRAESIELVPRRGTLPQPLEALALFTPLFFAFGLILLIGCANVANLLLARGVARQREIGVRLSLGASRRRIVRQLMTESVLLALAAAAGGYAVSRVALASLIHFTSQAMPLDLGDANVELAVPAADWRVAAFLLITALAATAFFALMPALRATRIAPLRTLRGEMVGSAGPGRARNALIGIQVFASALLLICAAIFLRSAIASSRFDPGFRTADTMIVQIPNEPKRAALVQAIASEPAIAAYAAVRPGILAWPDPAVAVIGDRRTPVGYKAVSSEYFDLFDIPIVQGRTFSAAERDGEHAVAVVTESTARQLWPGRAAVGETIRLEPEPAAPTQPPAAAPMPARTVTVVGVSRDVAGFRFLDTKEAGVFLPTHVHAPKTAVVVRARGESDLVHRALVDRLTRVDPDMGLVVTMRTLARLETFFLQIAFWVALVLGGLALLLTVSGLFSVLSYLVEQRTREIGVRIALGASSRRVTRLVLAQTARPVAYGLLAGAGVAAALATILLTIPEAAVVTDIVRVGDPLAYVASLITIVVACLLAAWVPAARAARLDPMRTLRQD